MEIVGGTTMVLALANVQTKKGQIELRECTRNYRQLKIIGVLSIKQRVGEEKFA